MAPYRLLLVAVVGCLVLGCGHKHAHTQVPQVLPPLSPTLTPAARFVPPANYSYDSLSIRGKAQVQQEQTNTLSYKINLLHGQKIWISVSAFGLEVARLLAQPDSFRLMDRLNHRYLAKDYSYLSNYLGMPITFATLECLLVGNTPQLDSALVATDSVGRVSATVVLGKVLMRYLFAASLGALQQVQAADSTGRVTSTLRYSNFKQLQGGYLPQELALEAISNAPLQVQLHHTSVDTHPQQFSFSFNVPAGYAPVR